MRSFYFFLYNLLLFILLPFFIIVMLFFYLKKDKRSAGFFGKIFPYFKDKIRTDGGIWVHAVSMGEVSASTNFIKLLRDAAKKPVYLSVVTKTGYRYAKTNLKDVVEHVFYFPYDFIFSAKRAVKLVRPLCFISVETEVWPNLFHIMKNKGIPVFIVNARLSEGSYRAYLRLKAFFSYVFKDIDLAACISESYSDRFLKLGVKKDNIIVTGNMKFDGAQAEDIEKVKKEAIVYRSLMNIVLETDKVIVAGSTHEGEEKLVLDAFLKLIEKNGKTIKLILAPRHPERFKYVEALILNTYKLPFIKLSQLSRIGNAGSKECLIMVDEIGVLSKLYSLANAAFVGGSMVNSGGHNLLEPLFFGKPVIFGKYIYNFQEIADEIISKNAGVMVKNFNELYEAISLFLYNEDASLKAAVNGQELIAANRGSSLKNVNLISDLLVHQA